MSFKKLATQIVAMVGEYYKNDEVPVVVGHAKIVSEVAELIKTYATKLIARH